VPEYFEGDCTMHSICSRLLPLWKS